MAYFNNAFRKTIVLSSYEDPVPALPGPITALSSELTKGQVSLYDAKQWTPMNVDPATATGCQFIIAGGAPYTNDRIGPFHGGYTESVKSKGINPKYVSKVWSSESNVAQPFVLNIGTTVYSLGKEGCCPTFLCGEQYHLRVDVKGDAVLRMLNHQGYVEVTADGGCCPDGSITPVEASPYSIMKQWAEGIWRNAIVTGNGPNFNGATTSPASERFNADPFIIPVIQFSTGAGAGVPGAAVDTLVYPPGSFDGTAGAALLLLAQAVPGVTTVGTWDTYTDTWVSGNGDCAGLMLQTAYVDTDFGLCTFQPSDHYNVEPIRIYASQVDLNGDPCEFEGICILVECAGRQAQGLGETVARDFILSESYRQIPFATDLRIREITQGNEMLGTGDGQVDKNSLYTRLMILHTVPRFNNPSGVFDNDQYLIEIVAKTDDKTASAGLNQLKTDLFVLLAAAGNDDCIDLVKESPETCLDPSVPVTA
tara:strand:- start:25 stop:1464 length:1440 start_codon:yes stop_codon:yes gene_type:complete